MDKLFGRRRKEDSDEKPADDITDSAGDGENYGDDAYDKKTSLTTGDDDGNEDYAKKSSDAIGGDEFPDKVGEGGGNYSEKASYDTADGSDEYGGASEKPSYAAGGGDDGDYSEKASYDAGEGGAFGGSDEYAGSEKPDYISGGGGGDEKASYDIRDGAAGDGDYSSEKTSDTFGGRAGRKGGYGGEDYTSEKASRGEEEGVGAYE